MKKIKQALISVSEKNKLKLILKILKKFKIKIISSGGTYKEIKKLGYKCNEVSKFTNSSEILDGRVKTLHPKIHAGILNKRNNKSHKKQMRLNKYENIDLVIVNFYPFEKTLAKTKNHKIIIENIDIGGPTLISADAKNFNEVIAFGKQLGKLLIITRGEKGSIAIQKNKVIECYSQKGLKIVDLTGAGDLFAAGFLHGHINNLSIKESLEKGTEMSSKIIQKIGARLN